METAAAAGNFPAARREGGVIAIPNETSTVETRRIHSSPLQNRVSPTGEIEAVAARGNFTGNRGVLHDNDKNLLPARWKHKNWIICELQFKSIHRNVMTPRRWTELFFLDEAVALAAGHRPCAKCRRGAYNAYISALKKNGVDICSDFQRLDASLHRERALPGARVCRYHKARLEDLPDGAFVLAAGTPALVIQDKILPWSHYGYGFPMPRFVGEVVLLTPPLSIKAMNSGFRPIIHPSAA